MQARFLLGPAGSGKTFRCLAGIRAALAKSADGPPLILLAPKQATFQLERQLLADGKISGFTRLQILSFDRLAQFIFEKLNVAPPKLLSAEGRLMVLRALLRRHENELKLFRGSARRAGFAQELGALLAELQQQRCNPAKLQSLAGTGKFRPELRDKLHDLALLSQKYADWLRDHELHDANHLLDFATEALRGKTSNPQPSTLNLDGLWLDGFAEMTPQELALLAAVIPLCERATLAFCLETGPTPEASWLSIWSSIGKTFQQCRAQISNLPGCEVKVEILEREPEKNRFTENSDLAELEAVWSLPNHMAESRSPTRRVAGLAGLETGAPSGIRIIACANPEAEAVFAAREVLKFVRAGSRFRDCAVLVRQLDGYHQPLARVFRRYGIPFFLDRRESVAHHPLAELTRNALRTVAFDWQNDDWFAALKAGFSPVTEDKIDDLENQAMESGWRGRKWREPLPDENCERLRKIIFPPFEIFFALLAKTKFQPDGPQLADALRGLWSDLKVEPTLARWTQNEEKPASGSRQAAIHSAVLEQINSWLKNLELAFANEPLPLREWLPVLDAGLGGLTVGVIPPSLDEVLIGAIDRARNPNLKFALVLGVNETIFPAAPAAPVILTGSDRDELENQNVALGANRFDQISRERYLGYIACTRANEKLAVTFSRQSADGRLLNPSPFIAQLKRIFPPLEAEEFSGEPDWRDAEHANELIVPLVEIENSVAAEVTRLKLKENRSLLTSAATNETWQRLLEIPALKSLAEKLARLREPDEKENLSPGLAEKLYGPVLKSSVSRLEEFAQCPFKFFVRSGLRAGERKVFELDARERGNFQHDVLKIFQEQLQAEGRRWRDLQPAEARERVGGIAEAQMEHFRDGLLRDSAETVFAARSLTAALQDFVEVIVGWMRSQYEFDPAAAELGFGGGKDAAPAWEIELGGGRRLALQGRIDRVDLWREPGGNSALAVVTDYKSGGKKLDALLVENGVQLQLLAYLGALRHWPNPREFFGAEKIVPAGAFYVNLRGEFKGGGSRTEVLDDTEAKKLAYRHNGRFDAGELRKFDRRTDASRGDQFNFRLNQDGNLSTSSTEALPREHFVALLDGVEAKLRELGGRIFSGAAAVDPYRKGVEKPCEFCDYRAACRIDEWTHEWRVLRTARRLTANSGR
ncbi:MAG TPA: PD-(D/E)XK nuclease family protein [Verrucomicrobiae bacterium]